MRHAFVLLAASVARIPDEMDIPAASARSLHGLTAESDSSMSNQ